MPGGSCPTGRYCAQGHTGRRGATVARDDADARAGRGIPARPVPLRVRLPGIRHRTRLRSMPGGSCPTGKVGAARPRPQDNLKLIHRYLRYCAQGHTGRRGATVARDDADVSQTVVVGIGRKSCSVSRRPTSRIAPMKTLTLSTLAAAMAVSLLAGARYRDLVFDEDLLMCAITPQDNLKLIHRYLRYCAQGGRAGIPRPALASASSRATVAPRRPVCPCAQYRRYRSGRAHLTGRA
jgi:hypothetical protein